MPGRRWNAKEIASLESQVKDQGLPLEQVKIQGRTAHAVRVRAVRSGLIVGRKPRYHWTAAQRKVLKQCKKSGMTPEQIFVLHLLGDPPRSIWAIKKMWGRMKLSDRKRSRRMKRKKRWKPGEKAEFKKFLKKHSSSMTPEQIAKQWKVARSTVSRWQIQLGVKQPRETVLRMEYSVAKQQRARQRTRRRNRQRWNQWREGRESELHELADELRSRFKSLKERTCQVCGNVWPLRSEFFHSNEKRIEFGKSRYYKNRCRICENTRRRVGRSNGQSKR